MSAEFLGSLLPLFSRFERPGRINSAQLDNLVLKIVHIRVIDGLFEANDFDSFNLARFFTYTQVFVHTRAG